MIAVHETLSVISTIKQIIGVMTVSIEVLFGVI